MAKRREMLRSGDWLTRERIRLVALAVLVASVLGAGFLIATANGLSDRFDRPLGTDFSDVYAAGTYVLDGEATAPFNPRRQITRERAIFGQKTPFYGWHYPPYFLGPAALFATMPYPLALALWQGVTLVLYLFVIREILATALWPGLPPGMTAEHPASRAGNSGSCSRSPIPPSSSISAMARTASSLRPCSEPHCGSSTAGHGSPAC
jgi:alpha-1,2-mannosyltransferase